MTTQVLPKQAKLTPNQKKVPSPKWSQNLPSAGAPVRERSENGGWRVARLMREMKLLPTGLEAAKRFRRLPRNYCGQRLGRVRLQFQSPAAGISRRRATIRPAGKSGPLTRFAA